MFTEWLLAEKKSPAEPHVLKTRLSGRTVSSHANGGFMEVEDKIKWLKEHSGQKLPRGLETKIRKLRNNRSEWHTKLAESGFIGSTFVTLHLYWLQFRDKFPIPRK
jgi:hypothetical protein